MSCRRNSAICGCVTSSPALSAIPARALVISFVWTVLSYGVLTLYDRLGTIYAGHKVSYGRVAFASFCAYALSHNLGFAAVSGAAVRYRLYAHWGLTPIQIAKTVAFCSLTFGLGGMVLGGAILFIEPTAVPFFGQHVHVAVLYAVGALLWAIVIGYVTLSRILGSVCLFGHQIGLPGWRMAILQVLLATVDVAITASIFYALLPHGAASDLADLPGRLCRRLHRGARRQPARRDRRVRHRDPARIGALSRRPAHRRRDRGVSALLLHHPAVPGRLPVHRQRDPAARRRSCCGGCERLGAMQALARWSEPDFAVASAHRPRRPGRCHAALPRHPGAAAGLLLDRSGLRRDRQPGGPVRSVADRRRPDRAGDRPVAPGEPGLGRDHLPAGVGRGLHCDAGRPAVDLRRAAGDHDAGRAAAELLLPARQPAERAAAAVHRAFRCSPW